MQITQGGGPRIVDFGLVFFTKTNSKAGGLWWRVGKGKRTQKFHIHRQERSSCLLFKSWIRGLKVGKVGRMALTRGLRVGKFGRRKLGVGLLVPS